MLTHPFYAIQSQAEIAYAPTFRVCIGKVGQRPWSESFILPRIHIWRDWFCITLRSFFLRCSFSREHWLPLMAICLRATRSVLRFSQSHWLGNTIMQRSCLQSISWPFLFGGNYNPGQPTLFLRKGWFSITAKSALAGSSIFDINHINEEAYLLY